MPKKLDMSYNEADVWDSFRAGDEEAFARIYKDFSDVLYSYGCRITTDKELVKDCLQDLFAKLWHTRSRLGPTTSIKYYMFRCLRREVAQKLKLAAVSKEDCGREVAECSFEEEWISIENNSRISQHLETALLHLSERQREAVYLRFYQSMEFDEIATLMDITPRAVYKLIYRAIDVLQKVYFPPSKQPLADTLISYPTLRLQLQ